ncbi:hypothetical protein [Streptomyces sp. 135]|uniref:hypothetical protein n=1 Tax=Streptomyces sp. 135 TaxID=2838850 RepID=UPI001CC19DA5|nr:hypothetical protein [Streptomyces sp. 135]
MGVDGGGDADVGVAEEFLDHDEFDALLPAQSARPGPTDSKAGDTFVLGLISNLFHTSEYFGALVDSDCRDVDNCTYGEDYDKWAKGYDVESDAYRVPGLLAAIFGAKSGGTGKPTRPRSRSAADGERLRKKLSVEAGRLPYVRSLDDFFDTPSALAGGVKPSQVRPFFEGQKGWREEGLGGQSRSKGKGWVIREYNERGGTTGRMLRWHPGGGHHGDGAYWGAVGYNGDLGGIIR